MPTIGPRRRGAVGACNVEQYGERIGDECSIFEGDDSETSSGNIEKFNDEAERSLTKGNGDSDTSSGNIDISNDDAECSVPSTVPMVTGGS